MWSKKPRVEMPAQAPAAAVPRREQRPMNPIEAAKPPAAPRAPARHRMAGSHDGLYITEHHRGAKKR